MDRNDTVQIIIVIVHASLSARRAWIEISTRSHPGRPKRVALRKESVDRNVILLAVLLSFILSLSARRAWIEIKKKGRARRPGQVALRKESVDRNKHTEPSGKAQTVALRKESVDRNATMQIVIIVVDTSLSARRAWIEILAYPDMIICTNGRSPQGERG